MKKVLLAIALATTIMVLTNGVKAQHPPYPPSQVRALETLYYPRGADVPTMTITCDAPRGNIVYVVTGDKSGGTFPIAVTAVHQPDLCKVEK